MLFKSNSKGAGFINLQKGTFCLFSMTFSFISILVKASMDIFLPWANSVLVKQFDKELTVKWEDIPQRCSTVKELSLELLKVLNINVHLKNRELYDALSVIAGLKKIEDKSLNSLDLRLRLETFLEAKLNREKKSKHFRKETNFNERLKRVGIQQSSKNVEAREKKKKRKHEKTKHSERKEKTDPKHNKDLREMVQKDKLTDGKPTQVQMNKMIKKERKIHDVDTRQLHCTHERNKLTDTRFHGFEETGLVTTARNRFSGLAIEEWDSATEEYVV